MLLPNSNSPPTVWWGENPPPDGEVYYEQDETEQIKFPPPRQYKSAANSSSSFQTRSLHKKVEKAAVLAEFVVFCKIGLSTTSKEAILLEGTTYGYVRVSTQEQNEARQLRAPVIFFD